MNKIAAFEPRNGTSVLPKKKDYRRSSEKTLDRKISKAEKALKLFALDSTLERVQGGYKGASRSRRWAKTWDVPTGTADELALSDRQQLVDRAQDLYRNTSIVRGVINTITENAIGRGLRLQSTIDEEVLGLDEDAADLWKNMVERRFHNWASSSECDATRRMDFYALQELAFRQWQIDGEAFGILPRFSRNTGGKSRLHIQLLPANRCGNPMKPNDELHRDGITFTTRGEPESYDFQKSEGYLTSPLEYVTIKAFGSKSGRQNVLHVMRPDFIGQSRGVPFIACVLEDLKNVDRYSKSELTNAAVSALFTGFIKSNRSGALDPVLDTVETPWNERNTDYTLDAGVVHRLNTDEDFMFANPNRPNSGFRDFIEAYLMLIGMATGLPYEVLVKRFQSSFSASKAARIEAWRHYLAERRRFEQLFCAPIFREWLIESVAYGDIDAPGFFDSNDIQCAYLQHQWFGDNQGQIDPVKETNAAATKIKNGLSTYQIEAAALGHDFEKNIQMLRRERKLMNSLPPDPQAAQPSLFEQPKLEDQEEPEEDPPEPEVKR